MAAGKSVVSQVKKLAAPVAQGLGLELWDIEYVKEGASWFLRIYIDKEKGVTIDDCEAFSRAIDKPLDDEDFIKQQYYLEVSSPGIERELKTDAHFGAFIGKKVRVRLIRPAEDGAREYTGTLSSYKDGVFTLDTEAKTLTLSKTQTAFVKAAFDTESDAGGNEPA